MADNPQLVRPENQFPNDNRQGLGIAQPGETPKVFDWGQVKAAREAAGRATQASDPGIGLGDAARSVAAAPFDMVSDIAEIPRAINQVANNYAEGQESDGAQQRLGLSDNSMETMKNIRGTVSKGVDATAGTVGGIAQSASDAIKGGYSEGAKQAAAMPFIEKNAQGDYKLGAGAFDKDAWMINAVPTLAQILVSGGVAKLGAMGARRAVEDSVFNKLSKSLPEAEARKVAQETAEKAAQRVGKSVFVGTQTATAQGQAGLDMHAQISALPYDQLMASPTFQKAFADVDSNPANSNLSDTEKLNLARNQVADLAASSVTTDPALLAVNIAASTLGDHTLLSLLTKKGAATGVISGMATGAAAEGGTEFAQGATQRYVQNQQLIDNAGQKIDPMQGVVEAGANQAVLGAGLGAGAGAIGGVRGRRTPGPQAETMTAAGTEQAENGTAPETAPAATTTQEEAPIPQEQAQSLDTSINGAPASRVDEFRDTPAYLRQDPRVQGFAENSEVQQALAGQAAPAPEQLIQQQMQAGDQGYTPEEQRILAQAEQIQADRARREAALQQAAIPRLPAPGDVNPGRGFPMPGPVRVIQDEAQAGRGSQFSADGNARRPTPGEIQEAQPVPDINRPSEPAQTVAEPTQNVASDKVEPGGELKLFAKDKPFSTERVAKFSKWGKMPGATVEKVGEGFGVRLPPEQTTKRVSNAETSPTLTAYHGTLSDRDITRFTESDGFGSGLFGKGINFTNDRADAGKYASTDPTVNLDFSGKVDVFAKATGVNYSEARKILASRKGKVYRVRLHLRDPLSVGGEQPIKASANMMRLAAAEADFNSTDTARDRFIEKFIAAKTGVEQFDLARQYGVPRIFRQLASLQNKDGLVIHPDIAPFGKGATHYLAFDPEQVEIISNNEPPGTNQKSNGNQQNASRDGGVFASNDADPSLAGDLKLMSGRSFPYEKAAMASRWAKMPGAVVEKVGDGYGVRVPGEESGTSAKKIEDFGEKIPDAAKDRWGQFSRAMETKNSPDEFESQPLSKVFPHPEYEQMADSGVDKNALATIAVLRSRIPTKPQHPGRVNAWAQTTSEIKDLAAKVINGQVDHQELRSRMLLNPALKGAARTIDLLSRLEPSQMKAASAYRVAAHNYSMYEGKEYPSGLDMYELTDAKGRSVRGVSDGNYDTFLKKAQNFIDQETGKGPEAKQTKLDIYHDRYTKDTFIGYRGASGVARIQTGFPDAATARAYLRDNREAIEQRIADLRSASREEQRRATNSPRTGEPRRTEAVTPEKFNDEYGFRGVQFGNYVEGERRQTNLDQAYDSLADLSEVLNIPKKAISLNGELGLAFGARGRGGSNAAAAHYEPGNVVINLTKNQGAGSLAHEWFHALDNYFGQADKGGGRGGNYLTEANRDIGKYQNGRLEKAVYPVRQEAYDAFKGVMSAIKKSGMRVRASRLDELRSKPYWNTDVELAARAFERYVLDRAEAKGISNDFLVNLRKSDDHGNPETYAYPTAEELDGGVRQAFDKLFATLKTRETDRGVALYSRQSDRPDGGLTVKQTQEIADNFMWEYNGNIPLEIKVFPRQEDAYGPQATKENVGRIPGAYHGAAKGRIVLNAASILHEADGRRTLQHEILGHYGLNTFKPSDKTMFLESILKTKSDPSFKKIWQQVEKNYSDKPEMYQAEEVFALAAELDHSERNARSGRRIIPASILHAFQMALRRAGLVKGPMKITELYDAVDAVSDGIRNGRRTQQIFPKTDQDQFSRVDENASESGGVSANGTDIGGGNVITNDGFTPSVEKPERGMRQPEAQYVADQWVRGMNGAAKIKVKVVQTQAEAADMMPKGIPKEYGTVHAIYQPELSRVVVVADNIVNNKELRAKLRHEVLAHHGLASVIGDVEYDRIIRVLHQTRDSKNATIREAWRQVEKSYADESLETQANEFLAHMAEKSDLTGLGIMWDNFVSLITNTLRKAGILKPGDIAPAEIRNILRTIAGRFKHTKMYDGEQPGTREFDDTFSRTDALYSRAATMEEETNRKMGFNVNQGRIAKAKSFYEEVRGKNKDELKSWLTETGKKLNAKAFDGLAPLKYAEDAANKSDATSSAYIGARMAAGAGSVTAATLEHGLPQYNKAEGIIERKTGTGKDDSLMGILDGLGSKREDFFKWIAGNRSERLMKEGRENNFTPEEIAYMKTLRTGNEALFNSVKKKYDAFTKSILDLQQDMGLIDPESRAQWEDAWYLPYYREAENGEITGPWTTRGIANQSSTVRKLKGSDKTIKDPIENLFNYVAKSVDASMKNEAMRRAVVNLADTGVLEVIDRPNKMDYQRIGKDVVKVYMDGQENLVQVNDPELYRSFTMINMEHAKGAFWTAARAAKKVLTISTTAMPDFIIRNFLRDSIHSWAINKDGFKPGIDSWSGFKKALKTDPTLVDMMFAGSTFGGGYSNVYDPASTASSIRKILRRKGYTDSQMDQFNSSIVRNGKEIMDKVSAGLEKYKHVSEASENANRIATYEAALRSGKSKAQASYEARDLMDFSMMGASKVMIGLSDMLPFFNARMQGLGKLSRAIKADPVETLKRGGMITAASLALMALNWDDRRYDELPDWDKDTYWHAWIGDQHIRFPKPFEIGLMFGTMPERLVRTFAGKDTPAKFGKLVALNFANTMAFNPIPQVALPIAEAYVNYDFFTGNPIENMSDSNLIAGARYNDQTSLIAREVGDALNLSPKMLDHIVNGYTGTLGAYVLGATNLMMRHMGDYGESPALRLDELPVIKSFFRDDPAKSTQFTEDFYKMMTEANQVYSTIRSFRKQGRQDDANQLLEDNRAELSQRKALTATQKQVRGLNQAIEMTRRDGILTSDEKRDRIDKLMARRNAIVKQTVERVNPYFN